MPAILIVDDEQDILDLLSYNLQAEGYQVMTAINGTRALAEATNRPDLIILDVMMPEMDGHEVCTRLRQRPETRDVPILFLTARAGEEDEVTALELGADDFVPKPVSIAVLLARVNALLRRNSARPDEKEQQHYPGHGLIIDRSSYSITVAGIGHRLPRKEFDLLWELARHADRIMSRQQLLDAVWGSDVYVTERTVDVHVRRVREKLGAAADAIETVKGVGYTFHARPST